MNKLNKCTHVCKTFRLAKCWISEEGTSALVRSLLVLWFYASKSAERPLTKLCFFTTQRRIKIDSWIDIGGGTLTFYQEQGKETSVINIPSVCIEKIDRDVQNGLVYIYTKSSLRADGASLFVFEPFPVVRSLRFV